MTNDRISALESIGFIWKSVGWMQRFEELKQYKGKEGHCNVPQRYSENKQLRVWVSIQRAQCRLFKEGKQSSMTNDRISALESIGFTWKSVD